MKEFKYKYEYSIRYVKKSPNKYTTIINKFKEMKRLKNLKIYSRIVTVGTFPYLRLQKLIKVTNNNRYYKRLCYQAKGCYIIPFRVMQYTRRLYKPISKYKNRRII